MLSANLALERTSITDQHKNLIEYYLVPAAVSYVTKAINVVSPSTSAITISTTKCRDSLVPFNIIAIGITNVDLVLLFHSINTSTEPRLARGKYCSTDSKTKR